MKRQRVYLREFRHRRGHIFALEDLSSAIGRDHAEPASINTELQSSARVANVRNSDRRGRLIGSQAKQEQGPGLVSNSEMLSVRAEFHVTDRASLVRAMPAERDFAIAEAVKRHVAIRVSEGVHFE